jgi:hypothetical protein
MIAERFAPGPRALVSGHEPGESLGRNQPIAPADEGVDLPPVGLRVQTDADPALGAKVRGNEKPRWLGFEKDLPRTFRDLAPERAPVVPRPLQSEDLIRDTVRRAAPHRFLVRFRKRKAACA